MKLAIILAAGRGKRFDVDGFEKPKGLIEFNGKPIIERSIELLFEHGIDEIYVITGYNGHEYTYLNYKYKNVGLIRNDNWRNFGSSGSFFVGLKHAQEENVSSCLFLDSDIVFSKNALPPYVSNRSVITLNTEIMRNDDSVYAKIDEKRNLTSLSKTNESGREYVGIFRLNQTDMDVIIDSYKYEDELDEYEETLIKNKISIAAYDGNFIWSEIDTISDYYYTSNNIIPLLYETTSI